MEISSCKNDPIPYGFAAHPANPKDGRFPIVYSPVFVGIWARNGEPLPNNSFLRGDTTTARMLDRGCGLSPGGDDQNLYVVF
jgi:hypothetical protein